MTLVPTRTRPTRSPTLAGFVALCVISSTTAVAAAGSVDDSADLLDATTIAADGAAIEEHLAEHGLGAAWRSATALLPRARAMTVALDEDTETATVALITTAERVTDTEQSRRDISERVLDAANAVDESERAVNRATIARNFAIRELEIINDMLALVAVDLFEIAFDGDDDLLSFNLQTESRARREREITQHTVEQLIDRKHGAEDRLEAAETSLDASNAALVAAERQREQLAARQSQLTAERNVLDDTARRLLPAVAEQWIGSEISGQPNLTPRALHAYLQAELLTTEENPSCRISWTTIAAIGSVEGAHGRHGNRELLRDGTSDEPIIGLPLDGATLDNFGEAVALIGDSDGGKWDEDPALDRAVGPMQFIPETWARWESDGDGDGESNPHDLDDAALAAAGYLCSYGSHRTWDIWNAAVFGYNHSNAYVASVFASHTRVRGLEVPVVDPDLVWQPRQPAGVYVPLPPEPEEELPEETGDGAEPAAEVPAG